MTLLAYPLDGALMSCSTARPVRRVLNLSRYPVIEVFLRYAFLANAIGQVTNINHKLYITIMNLFCQPMSKFEFDLSTGCDMIPKTIVDPANESNPTQTNTVAHRSCPRDAFQAWL